MAEGVGVGGAWVDKNFALALARLKKERKKEKRYTFSSFSGGRPKDRPLLSVLERYPALR